MQKTIFDLNLSKAVIIPGSFGLPVGLLLSGWGAQEHVHWILPDVVSDPEQSLYSYLWGLSITDLHSLELALSLLSKECKHMWLMHFQCMPHQVRNTLTFAL